MSEAVDAVAVFDRARNPAATTRIEIAGQFTTSAYLIARVRDHKRVLYIAQWCINVASTKARTRLSARREVENAIQD